jgi:hypothetical protein
MGFLDNSGDIILDVVLTDHGRKALSKGDGSFKIDRFALGDEEIDYSLYNSAHASGSSYYDLEILQTPILEAFTDNAASMKTKLVTYESLELLFLPILELNVLDSSTQQEATKNLHVVAVDVFTEDDGEAGTTNGIGHNGVIAVPGVLYGESITKGGSIMIDQGFDTTQMSTKTGLPADLLETSYTIQIDNRFGSIVNRNGIGLTESYIDDDNIAYYIVSDGEVNPKETVRAVTNISNLTKAGDSPIAGPRGSRLEFKIKSSMDLQTSSFLFTKLGGISTMTNKGGTTSDLYHIDTIVRVSGMNTGYSLDIPVRFVKLQ